MHSICLSVTSTWDTSDNDNNGSRREDWVSVRSDNPFLIKLIKASAASSLMTLSVQLHS